MNGAGASLEEIGYSPRWEGLFGAYAAAEGTVPGRVVRCDRGSLLVETASGTLRSKASTALLKSAGGPLDLPAVGDWVALLAREDLESALVEAVLSRTSAVVRGDPGASSGVQVLAANVDVVFVVHPIAEAPNLRRIERELSLAYESGALPVVVLTKADLSGNAEEARLAVESVAPGVDVHTVNAVSGEGADVVLRHIPLGGTAILIGPSGAGKSTLINALLGWERQATREVRVSDGRGRHTTVARELIRLPRGGVLIDTPGLRALGLTGSDEGIAAVFSDVEEAARGCRFGDCTHSGEPGCAVLAAIEDGTLPADRLASYHKLIGEARSAALRSDARLRAEAERRSKDIAKAAREYFKHLGHG